MSRVAPPLHLGATTRPTEQQPPPLPRVLSALSPPPAPASSFPLPPPPTLPLPVPLPPSPPPLPSAQPLPRLIWAYWHDAAAAPLPSVAAACVASWRRHAPEWQVRLLDSSSVREWLEEGVDYPAVTWSRTPAHQSDLFGLALVRRYGGLYMDATVLLTRPLRWLEARLRTLTLNLP